MPVFTPGLRLHDRFTLTDRIGLGGMSEVWRADDPVLRRTVAVKVLAAPLASDPKLRAATQREARAAARLTHPNVTQVYDYGEASVPGGVVPYLVMEFVDGENLADRLARGPLPGPEVATIGTQVASALAAAHRLGVVHRDVKPGNIMLTSTGAKVLDFGIAALAGAGDTDAGLPFGTPAYAAPERLRPGPANPASDVYALGALLYEMATGRPPIAARSWSEAEAAHRTGVAVPPLDLPGLPPEVGQLARSCLSSDPGVRPSAEQVAAGLAPPAGLPDPTAALQRADATARQMPRGYAVGSAALPHPPTMVEPAPFDAAPIGRRQRGGRSPLLLAGVLGAVAAVVLAAILVAVALWPNGNDNGGGLAGPTGPPTSTATSPSAGPSSPTAAPQGRDEIIAALGQQIDSAVAAGSIDPEAANDLRDRLSDLQKGNPRKRAADFSKKVNDLRDDGKIDQPVADQLLLLLQPLTGDRSGGDGDGGDDQ